MAPDQIVGTSTAGEILGIDQKTVSQKCRDGVFPHAVQDGPYKPWHIPLTDIEEYQRLYNRTHKQKK